jgi:hypothetical protein
MAASESVSKPIGAAYSAPALCPPVGRRKSPSEAALNTSIMMAADGLAVLLALCLASIFRFDLSPTMWLHGRPWLLNGRDFPIHTGYLLFFALTLLIINRRDGLYGPLQAQGPLHDQRKTIQACFGAGLSLCGGLYVVHDTTVARGFVAYFIALTTAFLCVLRWFWRRSLYRKYQRGIDTRNVLIASHIGNVVRKQIVSGM